MSTALTAIGWIVVAFILLVGTEKLIRILLTKTSSRKK